MIWLLGFLGKKHVVRRTGGEGSLPIVIVLSGRSRVIFLVMTALHMPAGANRARKLPNDPGHDKIKPSAYPRADRHLPFLDYCHECVGVELHC